MELVREIIAAVPDWDEVSALLHPDACFDQTRIPGGGVYQGREACGRFSSAGSGPGTKYG